MPFNGSLNLLDLRLARPILPRTDRTFRVLFLGDSVAMPQGVPAEQGVAFLLSQALARMLPAFNTEVINPSVGGMSFHHYATLAQANLATLQPDLIVLCVCSNDSEIDYAPLGADPEEAGRLQWSGDGAMVAHLRFAARRLAEQIRGVPCVLLGMNYLELPGAADMDTVLREISGACGWTYATTRGRLDTLPRERLVANDIDHHPSAYVHQLAVNEICLAMTRDLKLHQRPATLDVEALVAPLLERLADVATVSLSFRAELLRLIDLVTQKNNHLRKSPRAESMKDQLDQLVAVRLAMLELLELHAETASLTARLRGQESNLPADEYPLAMYQRMKLINASVHDVVARHLQADPSLPYVRAGEEASEVAATALLKQVEQVSTQLFESARRVRDAGTSRALVVETLGLPGRLASIVRRIEQMLLASRRDVIARVETRRSELAQLLGDAAEYGASLVERSRENLQAGGDRARAAARSLHQFVQAMQVFKGQQFQVMPVGYNGPAFWSPEPWDGAESAPVWTLDVEVTCDRRNAVGLWIDAVTPSGFLGDYQQIGPEQTSYRYTFGHASEFMLKLAGSVPFNVGKARLSDGRRTVDVSFIQRTPIFWRTSGILRVA